MDEANKATVRSLMPAAARGARIADLWSGSPEPPAVWILPASLSPARITVVGLFNWTEAPRTTELDPVTLGIAGKGDRVHVWDLTAMRYLGGSATGIEIPAGEVRLMAVAPDVTHPQLLGTDAHIASGAWDVSGVQWLSKYKALKGASRATPGVLFRIAVTEPKGYAFQNVEATGAAIERLPSEPGSLLFRITPDRSNVGWVVRYR